MLAAAIIWSAPLFGLAAAGHPFLSYLGFAPRTQFVPHPSFEWGAFVTLSLPSPARWRFTGSRLLTPDAEPLPGLSGGFHGGAGSVLV